MAKAKSWLTVMEMESTLGYEVNSLNYPVESGNRFYSDLRLVSKSSYNQTLAEFEARETNTSSSNNSTVLEQVLPKLNVVKTIMHDEHRITLIRRSQNVLYSITMDVHYGFGLDLSLLVTNSEAFRTLFVAKLQPSQSYSDSRFFKLPIELRNTIYTLALFKEELEVKHVSNFDKLTFTGGIGDPSGFYFPLSREFTALLVNKQMRQEALPFTYRRTVFHSDHIDDCLKFLVAVGKIGRDNIESLELTWESRADCEFKWDEGSNSYDPLLTLPTLHAVDCVQLLKQCKRLTSLRLYLDEDLITKTSSDDFKVDPGIRELGFIRGIKTVDIWGLDHKSLKSLGWLEEEMKSSEKEGEEGKGCKQDL